MISIQTTLLLFTLYWIEQQLCKLMDYYLKYNYKQKQIAYRNINRPHNWWKYLKIINLYRLNKMNGKYFDILWINIGMINYSIVLLTSWMYFFFRLVKTKFAWAEMSMTVRDRPTIRQIPYWYRQPSLVCHPAPWRCDVDRHRISIWNYSCFYRCQVACMFTIFSERVCVFMHMHKYMCVFMHMHL